MSKSSLQRRSLLAGVASTLVAAPLVVAPVSAQAATPTVSPQVRHRSISIEGVEVFYRSAGSPDRPAILLLHGFPTSSHMYRNLITALADRYHVIAPDYPGFGQSAAPDRAAFGYSFDHYARIVGRLTEALGLDRYALYLMDYGAPVGFRLATALPERVTALLVQNGNAYAEGIQKFWEPIQRYWASGSATDREAIRFLTSLEATKWQYTHGVADTSLVSPDAWTIDQAYLDRPGNQEIQLDLFYDYRTNIPLYPEWQVFLRRYRPPTLVVWGKNDQIFVAEGAAPYRRDVPDAEIHLLDAGHFALETNGPEIATLIRDFLARKLAA